MRGKSRLVRIACATGIAAAGTAGYLLACGPFLTLLRPVDTIRPAQLAAYNRGDLGVVREHFARRYLVQAYRRFSGRPPIAVAPVAEPVRAGAYVPERDRGAQKAWRDLHQRITGVDPKTDTDRRIGQYQFITNCLEGTFASAAATGQARADKYGATSAEVRDWVRAQDAVLANCAGDAPVLPEAAPANADALTRADRAYQTAAAYFYAMEFGEAAKRFKQIAADAASPWRPYGRYLSGRSLLRQATIAETLDRQDMLAAQAEFRAALADRNAAVVHDSAKGLIDLITFRIDPVQRLKDVSPAIATGDTVTADQLNEYERVMDVLLGDTTTFDYAGLRDKDAFGATADLNDWVSVMQGTGDGATARAVAQWKRTPSPAWLVAALWKVPPTAPEAPALLDAAGKLPATSPASLTTAFLGVRLLAARGETDRARALLATLPSQPRSGDEVETVNLLNAQRFKLARTLTELLHAAPRRVASERWDGGSWREPEDPAAPPPTREPVFDDDAGIVFSWHLPLTRLVEASTSTVLPPRLRLRVASAAFTRAWMLGRDQEALAVAPVLRALSPAAAADVQKFESAAPADRHIAGLRLLLRTPGLRADVTGLEDDQHYDEKELSRTFDHLFRRNWWCGFSMTNKGSGEPDAEVVRLLYESHENLWPSFLSADERAAVQRERQAIAALGTAPNYLAGDAVNWAKSRPQDVDAAEALAHAVEGTRWGCTDSTTSAASRTAFQTLHKLFPKSVWAQRTKYWY
jgi:hypothetical protein